MESMRTRHADVSGDPVDFRAWIAPHWDVMCLLADRLAAAGERDDVLQETLAAAWRYRDRFDPVRGTLRNWLLAITANQARKSHRSRRRWHQVPDPPDVALPAGEPDLDLHAAIAALPARQRGAIELYYVLDLPVRDVAAVLGCAEGTVKSTLAAARERLRTVLGEEHR